MDYEQIKSLIDAGQTTDEIATFFGQVTARPIPCADAKILLEESGLVIEDPATGQRTGTLIDRYATMPAGPLKDLLGWFIAHTFGRGSQISSDTQPRAAQLAGVIADLPAPLQPVAQALLALGGGQPYAGTTAADVQQVIDDHDAAVAEEEAQDARDGAWATLRGTVDASANATVVTLNLGLSSFVPDTSEDPPTNDAVADQLEAMAAQVRGA